MAKSKTAKDTKSATRDWIIRGVVFGGLAVLLVLALLDFRSKHAAQATSDAWRAAIRANGEDVELLKSEFGKIPVQGSPQLVSNPAGANPYGARTLETYTWSGIFRSYSVRVFVGAGANPPIESVEGPGEDTQEE